MMWDHTEVNPFVKASGSFFTIKKSIIKSLEYSIEKLDNNNQDDIKIQISQ